MKTLDDFKNEVAESYLFANWDEVLDYYKNRRKDIEDMTEEAFVLYSIYQSKQPLDN